MNQRQEINNFLEAKKIAVAGVSRNANKFGNVVYRDLLKKGFNVLPVNPNTESVDGNPCFKSITDLPDDVDGLICIVHSPETEKLVKQAHTAGIQNIWLQQGSESDEAVAYCTENGISVVSRACILMYADPVESIHKFHRGLAKLFGRYQK